MFYVTYITYIRSFFDARLAYMYIVFAGMGIARHQKFAYVLHYIYSHVMQHFYILLHR